MNKDMSKAAWKAVKNATKDKGIKCIFTSHLTVMTNDQETTDKLLLQAILAEYANANQINLVKSSYNGTWIQYSEIASRELKALIVAETYLDALIQAIENFVTELEEDKNERFRRYNTRVV
jgi:hypothetical protein